jgi:1-deoxy-D-xylulose-5-phosphate reductoisomerase
MKKVVILGSTGSVGTNGLDVIARHKGLFKVVGLAAYGNVKLLARQVRRFKPRLAALADASRCNELKRLIGFPQKIERGPEGVALMASMREADIVLVAMSGTASIGPILAALKAGKQIALANKESIVSAGRIIMSMSRTHRAKIMPVDSEHSSIFQCIDGRETDSIEKIFLMGSGGPLKDVPKTVFDRLKRSRILAHPVWRMGKKISVDSATMMNKGLEAIEASILFGIDIKKIEILLHPEAIIHSMVEYADGNIMANLFYPDMRIPILYALTYPKRYGSQLPRVNFGKTNSVSFQKPDYRKFPALGLCYRAAASGGTAPACLNAANDEAVRLYLEGKIAFTGIVETAKRVLSRHKNIKEPSLDEILHVDRWARETVQRFTNK